ncbi:hypothetical protein [Marinobacterium arenosum]|uniref:hypothetical protein n=1 Tax=Marinobacterium arenosum TaxID=2862496 RepID=UPI001C978255|nr:hypothetical protein [Marinobacterium arenosum]MBY4675606.1 hypothetical protein [Marinobacterium arenosum]
MELRQALRTWNGKERAFLLELYRQYREEADFIDQLLHLLERHSDCQRAASWLLKHHLEQSARLATEQVDSLFHCAARLVDWQSRLHLLQMMPRLDLPGAKRAPIENFVRQCLTDQARFVRAWAYNGFYLLASLYPELRPEVERFCQMALHDEPPSVRARVGEVLKQGYFQFA